MAIDISCHSLINSSVGTSINLSLILTSINLTTFIIILINIIIIRITIITTIIINFNSIEFNSIIITVDHSTKQIINLNISSTYIAKDSLIGDKLSS
jgi:hypothetical protein